MTKCLHLFLLLAASISLKAATKIAIIGTHPVADLLLEKISSDHEFCTLERTDIKKILMEHELASDTIGQQKLRNAFPHLELIAAFSPTYPKSKNPESRLFIFNAQNGFLLVAKQLPSKLETATSNALEHIRLAAHKLSAPNPIFVSIVSLRDGGIPQRYNDIILSYVSQIEDQLTSQPHIQLLERTRLDLVNQERDLSEQIYKLVPSSRLLRLEFLPGELPEQGSLNIYVTSVSDTIISQITIPLHFDSPQTNFAPLINFFDATPVHAKTDVKEEAERFVAEADRLSHNLDFPGATLKMEAATALIPNNLDYRRKLLILKRKDNNQIVSWEQRLDLCGRALATAQELARKYPEKIDNYYFLSEFFGLLYGSNEINAQNWIRVAGTLFLAERKAVLLKNRPQMTPQQRYECHYSICQQLPMYYYCFATQEEYCDALYAMMDQQLEYLKDNRNEHNLFWVPQAHFCWFIPTLYRNFPEKLLEKSLNHPHEMARYWGNYFQLLKKTFVSNGNKETFLSNYEIFNKEKKKFLPIGPDQDILLYELVSAHFPQLLSPHGTHIAKPPQPPFNINRVFSLSSSTVSFKEQQYREMKQKKHEVMQIKQQLARFQSGSRQAKVILSLAEVLRSRNDLAEIRLREGQTMLRDYLNDGNELCHQAFLSLYPELTISFIWGGPACSPKNLPLWGFTVNNGIIYFLAGKDNQGELWSLAYRKDNGIRYIAPIPFTCNRTAIASDHTRVAVGLNNVIRIIELNSPQTTVTINDLPAKRIQACTFLDDRLYVFLGSNYTEFIIFSYDIKSGKRTIELSSKKEIREFPIERNPHFDATGMLSCLSRHSILFGLNSNGVGKLDGLYEWIPSSRKLTMVSPVSEILCNDSEYVTQDNTYTEYEPDHKMDHPLNKLISRDNIQNIGPGRLLYWENGRPASLVAGRCGILKITSK